jgi:hypothetical protein
LFENRFAGFALHAAVAAEAEDDGESDAGVALDLLIELDEGNAEHLHKQLTDSGFAGAAKSDQNEAERHTPACTLPTFSRSRQVTIARTVAKP